MKKYYNKSLLFKKTSNLTFIKINIYILLQKLFEKSLL